jgi:DNA-binding beta-propeller fold protein YncE
VTAVAAPCRDDGSQSTRPDSGLPQAPEVGADGRRATRSFSERAPPQESQVRFDLGLSRRAPLKRRAARSADMSLRSPVPSRAAAARASVPLAAWLLAAGFAAAQQVEFQIPLSDGDPNSPDRPFGIAMAPDGAHAYVPLAGDLSFSSPQTANNADVALVDVLAGAQVGQGPVGLYPEEAAVLRDAAGAALRVYVSNSTDGTVSALSPDLQTTFATIPLSPCFGSVFFGSFPYGLLLNAAGTRLYVTTAGGCDLVDVVDVVDASPTFHQLVGSFTVAGASGRPSWRNATEMVLPVTSYDSGFTSSQAGFAIVDPAAPAAAAFHFVTAPGVLAFHSANEALVAPGDRVLVPVFGGTNATLVEASLATGAVLRTYVAPAALTSPTLHGLALSPDASLCAVTSLTGGDTLFVDMASFLLVGFVDHGATSQPNEVVFTPDGSRAVVTLQGASRVDVVKHLPLFDLLLDVSAVVPQGTVFTPSVRRIEAGRPFAVYFSAVPGPTLIAGLTLHLGLPFFELFSGFGAVDGAGAAAFAMPVDPALSGVVFYTQAVTVDRDGTLRLSNGGTTTVP